MYSIGSSEIVNGELLALFRCDDGHQMWLSNYDEENAKKNVLEETSTESQSDPVLTSGTVSVLADIIESEDISLQTDYKPVPIPITKKEAVLKIGSAGTNFTSDVSIKKFGVETLLHKKIESDRVFAEAIEEEKNELLYIMNTQKRLFEIAEESNLKFRPFENPIKFSIYTILSVILISSL
tara:strand:+ start:100 stop:642 length:543 start_codon:yes stop_codon:yes gene_type:complete